jgi:hypothetical protein
MTWRAISGRPYLGEVVDALVLVRRGVAPQVEIESKT